MQQTMQNIAFDEMVDGSESSPIHGLDPTLNPRAHYQGFAQWLAQQPEQTLKARREEAELIFRRVGITFAVYGDTDGTERTITVERRRKGGSDHWRVHWIDLTEDRKSVV